MYELYLTSSTFLGGKKLLKTLLEKKKMLVTNISSSPKMFSTSLAHLSTMCSRGAFRVVMCLLSVINNFFQHLLLPNRWANLDQTWQGCSLGVPLQKLFTEFDSIKNSGCHGNEIEFFKQFFKNLVLWNHWSDFEIISQKCTLGDPFQKCSQNFDPSKNMALVNWDFLHHMDMKKFLRNLCL